MYADRLMTYGELAEFLGRSEEAARQLAKRRRWRRVISNEDGRARVSVPIEFLEQPRSPVDPRPEDEPDAEQPAFERVDEALSTVVTMLRDRVESLESELATARTVADAERMRANQVEVLSAILAAERVRVEEARAECEKWQAKADQALDALLARTAVEPRSAARSPSWWPFRRTA